jgi:RNA polymerase sigma factor (sigma-70 family)
MIWAASSAVSLPRPGVIPRASALSHSSGSPPLREQPDEELVRLALAGPAAGGGSAASSELLARHQRRVYLWCYRYVRDHERALDLAQEVLLSAHRGLAGFAGRSHFSSWLFAITRNRCLDAVAAPRWLRDDAVELASLPDHSSRPEAPLEIEQNESRLRRALSVHLDETEGRALWLLAVERLSVEEITRVLRLDNATGARGLLQRARRKLRSAMERGELRGET